MLEGFGDYELRSCICILVVPALPTLAQIGCVYHTSGLVASRRWRSAIAGPD